MGGAGMEKDWEIQRWVKKIRMYKKFQQMKELEGNSERRRKAKKIKMNKKTLTENDSKSQGVAKKVRMLYKKTEKTNKKYK